MRELGIDPSQLLVPEHASSMGAIGAALRAEVVVNLEQALALLEERLAAPITYPAAPRLTLARTEILPRPDEANLPRHIPLAALGVDIGSVSTKAAVITRVDGQYRILASHYRRTDGDPLAAVRDTLGVLRRQLEEKGYRIDRVVAATTGSGRYLTADYLGAELIKNEITAQAQGALAFIPDVESIFEIGGQDSKYIAVKDGVIVDFEMNKACAAGTGAFLEKQAANLGVALEEFGERALAAQNPPELDWQCTVFSESAVHHYRRNNVPVEDLCAGICLASVRNYLSKNVGSRPIGNVVAFQGAVAFNRGMVAAYETILGRRIVVPPYPHLTGAIGAARIAYEEAPAQATFRGFDAVLEARYSVSSFECKACPNHCDVNTFRLEGGETFYYNDRCEKYSGRQKRRTQHNLPDLFAEREEMLFSTYSRRAPEGAPRVGIPRIGMFNEYFPFYQAFFTELGFEVVPSDPTNSQIIKEGVATVAAEPCFPIKVAHGHVANVLRKGVDYLFIPGVMRAEYLDTGFCESQTCPYIQGLPELVVSALRLDEQPIPILQPRLHFNRGRGHLRREMGRVARQMAAHQAQKASAAANAPAAAVPLPTETLDRTGATASSEARPRWLSATRFKEEGQEAPHAAPDAAATGAGVRTALLDPAGREGNPVSPGSEGGNGKSARSADGRDGQWKHPGRRDGRASARRIERALDVALQTLAEFRRRLAERGSQVLQSLPPESIAFVVMGRPYTLHDAAVNMNIGKKIQDLGILAIPQ
ncbi:MAG: acyl-CoA dehydratase activase-related protein, partial [Armatimonadota bacterium]|nr:acyl-CoA dehydratase activase-related protein [Armatimonadota bacterium]